MGRRLRVSCGAPNLTISEPWDSKTLNTYQVMCPLLQPNLKEPRDYQMCSEAPSIAA